MYLWTLKRQQKIILAGLIRENTVLAFMVPKLNSRVFFSPSNYLLTVFSQLFNSWFFIVLWIFRWFLWTINYIGHICFFYGFLILIKINNLVKKLLIDAQKKTRLIKLDLTVVLKKYNLCIHSWVNEFFDFW